MYLIIKGMICQSCGAREASLLVQTVVNNHVSKIVLCADCAAKFETQHPLNALMKALETLSSRARAHAPRCAICRTSLVNFKETGRFGCPNCYEHFHALVHDLLPRVHAGAYRHRGKTPGRR